jgi:ATP-dependent Clp protease ATP-binding subunit ClpB
MLNALCVVSAALLKDKGSFVEKLTIRAGGAPDLVRQEARAKLDSLPRQDPAPPKPGYGVGAQRVFDRAQAIRKDHGDTHIAQDHMLLALMRDVEFGPVFERAGVTISGVEEAMTAARARDILDEDDARSGGYQRAAGAFLEETFDALEKYGLDLTELAAGGKLDPVIVRTCVVVSAGVTMLRRCWYCVCSGP